MRMKVRKAITTDQNRRLRVCAYVRVSSKTEELENSMENQIRFFEEYIKSNPARSFAGIYCDYGISGYKANREQFRRMLQDAREGKIDLIVVKSVSRFARNTLTMLEAVRELKRLGVGVLFVVQNLNTLTASGELMLTVHSAFAQAESEKDGALVRWGLHRKFGKGEPLPKTLSTLGYRKGPGETIEIDEEKAATVRLIFDLAGKGIWPTKIRDYLNVCGIPAPRS